LAVETLNSSCRIARLYRACNWPPRALSTAIRGSTCPKFARGGRPRPGTEQQPPYTPVTRAAMFSANLEPWCRKLSTCNRCQGQTLSWCVAVGLAGELMVVLAASDYLRARTVLLFASSRCRSIFCVRASDVSGLDANRMVVWKRPLFIRRPVAMRTDCGIPLWPLRHDEHQRNLWSLCGASGSDIGVTPGSRSRSPLKIKHATSLVCCAGWLVAAPAIGRETAERDATVQSSSHLNVRSLVVLGLNRNHVVASLGAKPNGAC